MGSIPSTQIQIINEDVQIDEPNKKILNILINKGLTDAAMAMFTGDRGEQLSYAEMRMRYG